MGLTPCKAEQPLGDMELQEKKAQKRLQDTEKMSVNSRLKATKIIGQRIPFYRQRIPDSKSLPVRGKKLLT